MKKSIVGRLLGTALYATSFVALAHSLYHLHLFVSTTPVAEAEALHSVGSIGGSDVALLYKDLVLLLVFVLCHSLLTEQKLVKFGIAHFIPHSINRALYNLATCFALEIIFAFWSPVNIILWQVDDPPLLTLPTSTPATTTLLTTTTSTLLSTTLLSSTRSLLPSTVTLLGLVYTSAWVLLLLQCLAYGATDLVGVAQYIHYYYRGGSSSSSDDGGGGGNDDNDDNETNDDNDNVRHRRTSTPDSHTHAQTRTHTRPYRVLTRPLRRLYQHHRHPLFLAPLALLWCHPTLTLTHGLFAATLTLYMLGGGSVDSQDVRFVSMSLRLWYEDMWG